MKGNRKMRKMIESYDPNMSFSEQTIRVTFMLWDYVGHIAYKMRGNVRGSALFEDFLYGMDSESVDDLAENDCKFSSDDGGCFRAILKKPDGSEMVNQGSDEDFYDMVTRIEIVKQVKED